MSHIRLPVKTALAIAIASAIGSGAALAEQEERARGVLEEIVVTATRRSERLQSIPVAVQAIGGEKLRELGVDSFEDYISMLPGVTSEGQAPGKQEVFIRGVSPGRASAVRLSGIAGEPSVAFYLDEAAITTPGRNIDLYAVDLDRIEVLKGPQGTLFGASSQAGTIRLITNKPDLSNFEAGGTAGLSSTEDGGLSNKVEFYANFPLAEDVFAVRIAAYRSEDGGYIDNIPATVQISLGNPAFGGTFVPNSRQEVSNADFVEDDYNNVEYRGFRVSGLWQINDDWDLLLQHTTQQLDTEGAFEYDPTISTDDDLAVATFSPTYGDDRVELTQWTLNGMFSGLEVIYNGSFTKREFEGQTDYTAYSAIGPFIPYYICTYPGYADCFNPVLTTLEDFETDRKIHEVRFSSDAANRFRVIAGVYFDVQKLNFLTDFFYPGSVTAGFFPNFPIPGAFTNTDGSARQPGVTFFNDFQTDREELAFFGEATYDITDSVTVSFGARKYDIEIGLKGQSPYGQRASGPEAAAGVNVDNNLAGKTPVTLSDTIIKANISWEINNDAMVYFTYSEGFRGGGFNRAAGVGGIPATFDTDDAENIEFGWKTIWLDNTLRINGAIYSVDFSDLQQGVLDFSIANTTFFDNVGSAEIRGLELETEWAATDHVTLFGSLAYIDSELTEIPTTLVNIAPIGSTLPYAPENEIFIGASYRTEIGGFETKFQGTFKWTDDRTTSLIAAARVNLPSYTQVNLSASIRKDNWWATVFLDNATNELGQLSAGSPDNVFRIVPTRPRTLGFRFSYDY